GIVKTPPTNMDESSLIPMSGGCHCGAVKFVFQSSPNLIAWDCNCSICTMKRNTHTMVHESLFKLLTPAEALTEYRFGTGVARHLFCKTCGVQSFYRPRSNPDAYAVTVACIAPGTVKSVTIKKFQGTNWEA